MTISLFSVALGFTACRAHQPLEGVTLDGRKIYLDGEPRLEDPVVQAFLHSERDEAAKIRYLLERLREAQDLVYIREGQEHPWTEAYRGVTWLIRRHYEPEKDFREFIKRHSFNPTAYVRYPDGTLQIAYYVIINELDWLKQAA